MITNFFHPSNCFSQDETKYDILQIVEDKKKGWYTGLDEPKKVNQKMIDFAFGL